MANNIGTYFTTGLFTAGGYTRILTGASYLATVAGRLVTVDVYVNVAGDYKIKIFRDDGTNYNLIGEQTVTLAVGQNLAVPITIRDIAVNDIIGIYYPTGGRLFYGNASAGDSAYIAGDSGTSLKSAWTSTTVKYALAGWIQPQLKSSLSITAIISRVLRLNRQPSGSLSISGIVALLTYEIRTMYVMGDYLYALVGSKLYKIDTAWTKTLIGTIGSTTKNAWIVGDGTNLALVDGAKGYSWNGSTFAEISFPDSFVPSSLTFQDGYFIVSRSGTGRFYISALNDPTSWDALDYATAEGLHDNLVTVHSHQRDLWLLGTDSLEIWYNSGASTFPFERYVGGFLKVGCKAARSVVSSGEGVFWLDNQFQVRIGLGIQSVNVSTPQIEYQIAEMAKSCEIENAVGFYYFQKGHGFYQLSIGDKTFVYDITTKFWHTRATGELNHRHPAQCYAFFNKKPLVGHYSRGQVLSLDYDCYTNNGEHFKAIRTAQVIHADRKRIFHNQLEIELESGVGVDASTEPEAILEWSDDGGKTWSSEHTATFGAAGEYGKRCIWRRLGNSRSRIYRVTIDDPVKRIIIAAHLDAQAGA